MFSFACIEGISLKEFLTLHFRIQKAICDLLCAGLVFQLVTQSWVIFYVL